MIVVCGASIQFSDLSLNSSVILNQFFMSFINKMLDHPK